MTGNYYGALCGGGDENVAGSIAFVRGTAPQSPQVLQFVRRHAIQTAGGFRLAAIGGDADTTGQRPDAVAHKAAEA